MPHFGAETRFGLYHEPPWECHLKISCFSAQRLRLFQAVALGDPLSLQIPSFSDVSFIPVVCGAELPPWAYGPVRVSWCHVGQVFSYCDVGSPTTVHVQNADSETLG